MPHACGEWASLPQTAGVWHSRVEGTPGTGGRSRTSAAVGGGRVETTLGRGGWELNSIQRFVGNIRGPVCQMRGAAESIEEAGNQRAKVAGGGLQRQY